jgi:hypothetical protein
MWGSRISAGSTFEARTVEARLLSREKKGNQVFYSIADEMVVSMC